MSPYASFWLTGKRMLQVNPHYDYDASEQLAPTQADDRSGSTEPAPQAQLASLERQAADRPAVQPACAAEAGLTGGTGWLGAHKVPPYPWSLCPACQCCRLAEQLWVRYFAAYDAVGQTASCRQAVLPVGATDIE